ncbi:MAG: type II secretion system F family protein [Candidatus Gracilibacteria bacterium]|nr:type II secretion system F family protein [Candidatus Gracilibacteria bacterium]MDD3120095.1 type II secretion system F family protein [Candidatus Gracilibacteria bacterium]
MSEDIIILGTKKEEIVKKSTGFSIAGLDEMMLAKQKLKLKHKVGFYRLLATMVNAGMSIMKSLNILERQEKNPVMKKFYLSAADGIKEGKNFSEILRGYNENFSDSECSIIESGEKTGKLNHSLLQLADQMEKIASISRKLKGALIYPTAIMVVMFAAMSVLMVAVVPKILEIFGDDQSKLPQTTKALVAVSDFFVKYWPYMLFLIIASVIGISIAKKTPTGKLYFDKVMLKIPIVGNLTQKVILSKFARVLSNLLSSGISIVESLRILSDIVDNEVYRQRILLLREDVKRGIKIGDSLENDPLFPDMLIQMIKVGEQTAKLDTIIIKLADFYDEEVDTAIEALQKTMEPIIIVIMAIGVGFIAVGIMGPIMNMADTISGS